MPRGLRVVRIAATLLALAFVAGVAAGLLDVVPASVGYSVGGRAVSRAVWMRVAAPLLAVSAAWFGGAAAGLWLGRPWSRVCVVAAFGTVVGFALIGVANGSIPRDLAFRAVAQSALVGAIAGLYLYRSPSASRYFDALRERR